MLQLSEEQVEVPAPSIVPGFQSVALEHGLGPALHGTHPTAPQGSVVVLLWV